MNRTPIIYFVLSLLIFPTLTSCKDTPEKVMKDDIRHIEGLTLLLHDIVDGKVTSSEAVIELEAWRAEMHSIDKRIKELKRREYKKFDQYISQKLKNKAHQHFSKCLDAMRRLKVSNKLTMEIVTALEYGPKDSDSLRAIWFLAGPNRIRITPASPTTFFTTRHSGVTMELDTGEIDSFTEYHPSELPPTVILPADDTQKK